MRALGHERLGTLFDAPPLGREFGPQLIAFGDDFGHRERHLHFQPPRRQTQRPPPEGRQKHQRQESRDEEPERKNHYLFDHVRMPGSRLYLRRTMPRAADEIKAPASAAAGKAAVQKGFQVDLGVNFK